MGFFTGIFGVYAGWKGLPFINFPIVVLLLVLVAFEGGQFAAYVHYGTLSIPFFLHGFATQLGVSAAMYAVGFAASRLLFGGNAGKGGKS
ncbi:MAG: hypothetical protein MR009_07160 [Sutterellaceae bacterium]|nr:hypothetical protein [Sutterellaceae bacterium]MDD7442317.1 hypothetical protein [Sutterellaceae bacterium]MDY2868369.1 hypothetical protein [Mesosutterella sp.]